MAYDLEEQESLDQLKAWWEKWGTAVLSVITVGCLAFAAWNGWNWYQRYQGSKATIAYVQLQNAFVQGDAKNVVSIADGLMKEYPGNVFAGLAGFYRAAEAQRQKKPDEARQALNWIINESGRPEYETAARVRLAGIELDAGKADAALSVLTAAKPLEADAVSFNDRLGDVYFALKRYGEAKAAWEKALKADAFDGPVTPLLNIKLQSLPVETK